VSSLSRRLLEDVRCVTITVRLEEASQRVMPDAEEGAYVSVGAAVLQSG